MKTSNMIIGISLLCGFFATAFMFSGGAPAGKTGSDGDHRSSCTQCHAGKATAMDGLLTGFENQRYIPGLSYDLNLHTPAFPAKKYGFEIGAEFSDGSQAGEWVITDPDRTKFTKTHQRTYLTHTTEGTQPEASGSITWSFRWLAPESGKKAITFFLAVNAANGDKNVSGDKIFLSSLTVEPENMK